MGTPGQATERSMAEIARAAVLELLSPPPHRGPLIAAGAVLVTIGVALEEIRLSDELGTGVHLLILAASSALILGLGLRARLEGGRPPAFQSVLLVCGLGLLYAALLTLSDVLGAEFTANFPAGAFVWTSLLLTGAALWPAARLNSAICALIAAFGVAVALLSAMEWIFDPDSVTTFRWTLLVLAVAFGLASLVLRAGYPRHAEHMVNAAGLSILAIPAIAFVGELIDPFAFQDDVGGALLPNGWELLVLAAGCGLLAVGAIDRAPGAAWLGLANLLGFVASAGPSDDQTLRWWPIVVLVLGVATMAAGLRPRAPLPPEPRAYRAGDLPVTARADDEETVVRVRDDSPP